MSRVIVSKIVDCLRELSDINYQKRVWLASTGPEISSYTEAVCQLFDDSGLGVELEKHDVIFSEDIDNKLRVLHTKLAEIDDSKAPFDIINEPKMKNIRLLSMELLKLLSQRGQGGRP
jgi:hypothetical protein